MPLVGSAGPHFTSTTEADAIANGQYFTFDTMVMSGYSASVSSLTISYRRSTTGPATGNLQFSTDGSTFAEAGALSYTNNTTSGSTLAPDLTAITALQNIGGNTDVTFRIVNYGGQSAGNFYIFDVNNSATAPDLILNGTVTAAPEPTSLLLLGIGIAPIVAGRRRHPKV